MATDRALRRGPGRRAAHRDDGWDRSGAGPSGARPGRRRCGPRRAGLIAVRSGQPDWPGGRVRARGLDRGLRPGHGRQQQADYRRLERHPVEAGAGAGHQVRVPDERGRHVRPRCLGGRDQGGPGGAARHLALERSRLEAGAKPRRRGGGRAVRRGRCLDPQRLGGRPDLRQQSADPPLERPGMDAGLHPAPRRPRRIAGRDRPVGQQGLGRRFHRGRRPGDLQLERPGVEACAQP